MRALRCLFPLALLLLGPVPARAQSAPTPGAVRVELLTMGLDDDVYGRYGHAAFRVIGPGASDRVFNFGITDWTKPNYIRDFLTGRVRFWGNDKPYERTLGSYKKWDRTVWRQTLALTDEQVQRLVARLEHDVMPEYREYIYDTFRDNCSTRLRDYLDEVTGGAVRRQLEAEPLGPSYREDVRQAFAMMPSLLLLTEIIPGVPLDAPRSTWERAYLPAELQTALQRVKVTVDGREQPLAGPAIAVYERQAPLPDPGWPQLGQAILAGAALVVFLLGWLLGRAGPRTRGLGLILWMLPQSLLGLVLVVVAVGTIWPDMKENWLVLAFVPLDLWLFGPAVNLIRRKRARAGRVALIYTDVRLAIVLLLTGLGPVVPAMIGPLPPRLLAAAGLFLTRRALRGTSRE